MFTTNVLLPERPVMSVTVKSPSCVPSSPKVRCGFGPNDVVPFEKFQTYDVIGHADVVSAENETGEPSCPLNAPANDTVGFTLLGNSSPSATLSPSPSSVNARLASIAGPKLSSKIGVAISGMPNGGAGIIVPISNFGCWIAITSDGD